MTTAYRDDICLELERLPEDNLRALLAALRLAVSAQPVRRWSSAVGTVSDEDAEQMRRAVEEGCEGVDADEW